MGREVLQRPGVGLMCEAEMTPSNTIVTDRVSTHTLEGFGRAQAHPSSLAGSAVPQYNCIDSRGFLRPEMKITQTYRGWGALGRFGCSALLRVAPCCSARMDYVVFSRASAPTTRISREVTSERAVKCSMRPIVRPGGLCVEK